MNNLKEYLENKSKDIVHYLDDPDFCPYDIANGHADDTYWAGVAAGEVGLARELLEKFFKDGQDV